MGETKLTSSQQGVSESEKKKKKRPFWKKLRSGGKAEGASSKSESNTLTQDRADTAVNPNKANDAWTQQNDPTESKDTNAQKDPREHNDLTERSDSAEQSDPSERSDLDDGDLSKEEDTNAQKDPREHNNLTERSDSAEQNDPSERSDLDDRDLSKEDPSQDLEGQEAIAPGQEVEEAGENTNGTESDDAVFLGISKAYEICKKIDMNKEEYMKKRKEDVLKEEIKRSRLHVYKPKDFYDRDTFYEIANSKLVPPIMHGSTDDADSLLGPLTHPPCHSRNSFHAKETPSIGDYKTKEGSVVPSSLEVSKVEEGREEPELSFLKSCVDAAHYYADMIFNGNCSSPQSQPEAIEDSPAEIKAET